MLLDTGELLTTGEPKNVVETYQRLLYAPDDKRNFIREKICSFNYASNANASQLPTGDVSLEATQQAESELAEFFDPNLVPQSTLAYESRGAYIDSPEIRTLGGKKVNCIVQGRRYLYTYKVFFNKAATNVRFGMLVKTVSGLELGGGASALTMAQAISYIASGVEGHVELGFTTVLNPGTYFLNAGVVASVDEEEIYLHRILDACMFRVLPNTDSFSSGGVCFSVSPKVIFVDGASTKQTALQRREST
jgi:lipopolysaccharide transport system ATP-binding protein